MSKNIQLIQEAYSNFSQGNIPAVLEALDDDIVWIDSGEANIPYAGKCVGKEEVLEFFKGMAQALTYDKFEVQKYFEDGNVVLAKGFFSGKSNEKQKPFASNWVMLWEVIDGKVKNFESFVDTNSIAQSLI